MEADNTRRWFDQEKVATLQLRFSTVTGDHSLEPIVSQCRSEDDMVRHVGLLVAAKQVKASLRLRELAFLCMGGQVNESHARAMEDAFVEQCSREPAWLLEVYCEMLEEFRLVKIDFAHSYCVLIRAVLHRCPGTVDDPCFAEASVTENLLLKKLSEVESHYARVVEQERQCRNRDVV